MNKILNLFVVALLLFGGGGGGGGTVTSPQDMLIGSWKYM